MLESFYIKSLFDLYTYKLDFGSEESGDSIKFITGPNGYGKTTILNILEALYTYRLEELSKIHFDEIELIYDDGHGIDILQKRIFAEADEDTDERQCQNINFEILFYKDTHENKIYSITWNSSQSVGGMSDLGNIGLSLFFSSHPVYYIRDKRMHKADMTPTVNANALLFETLLRDMQNKILTTSGNSYFGQENIDDEDLEMYIEVLLSCNLIGDKEDKGILKNGIVSNIGFIRKLQAFATIIKKAEFANKELQISPRYGYRFRADDEDRTILSAECLSSGEQQIMIMAYELLFVAPDDSLVLIDEPELSFHPAWQGDFLDNMKLIVSLKPMQCIVSTHSPQIFKNFWHLSVDLFEKQIHE